MQTSLNVDVQVVVHTTRMLGPVSAKSVLVSSICRSRCITCVWQLMQGCDGLCSST